MALIIFPTDSYDSFCSLVDAETILSNYIPLTQRTEWDALDTTAKEIQLRQATLLITQKVEELPETLESELQRACAFLANHSVGKDLTNSDGKQGNIKIKEITGVVSTEYFNPSADSDSLPTLVANLLSKYDVSASGAFSFSRG